ncbi:hypothetical protein [Lysobacter capsici]|uniref:hypothetical protein n=1 Tax=Lysobacter capsici TaxID=435897 RepID=UPI00062785D1|nr:hypothetical protein [Lysobacter capsici]
MILVRNARAEPDAGDSAGGDGGAPRSPRHRRTIAIALALLTLALAASWAYAHWREQRAQETARATAALDRLFESRLGIASTSGLGRLPFVSRANLIATEAALRRLCPHDQPAVRARGLAVLARSYTVIGDYRHAQALIDEAERLLREHGIDDPGVDAASASLLNLQARYDRAEVLASQALRPLQNARDAATRMRRLALQTELARAKWGLADDDGAMAMLESALADARALGPAARDSVAELLTLRGEWRTREYQLRAAERDLEQAIAMTERGNPLLADAARFQLVHTLLKNDLDLQARAQAEQLLAYRRRAFGERHPETGRAWVLASEAQYLCGDLSAAVQSAARARAIIVATYGEQHPEYAELLRQESQNDAVLGHGRAAIAKARAANTLLETTLGPTHERSLRAKYNLAIKLVFSGDASDTESFKQGVGMLEEVIRTGKETDIPMPLEKTKLALAFAEQPGEAAQQHAERLLIDGQIENRKYFPPHANIRLVSDFALAQLLVRRRRDTQADGLFADVIAHIERGDHIRPTMHSVASKALLYRASYALSSCRKDQALTLLGQQLAYCERHLGPGSDCAASTRVALSELEHHDHLPARFAEHGGGADPTRRWARRLADQLGYARRCVPGITGAGDQRLEPPAEGRAKSG